MLRPDPSVSELFGRYLVRGEKISEDEFEEALRIQSEINRSFASKALEGDFVTIEQFKEARMLQRRKGILFSKALIELGYANQAKINAIENTFSQERINIGELLIKRGSLSKEDLDEALEKFKEYAEIL